MLRRQKIANVIAEILIWIFVLLFLVPFFLLLWNSLKNRAEANLMNFALPTQVMLENYVYVWRNSEMLRAFFNSFIIAFFPVAFSTISAAMCAFVLSRHRSRLYKYIYSMFLLGLVLPVQILPVIRLLKTLHLMGGYAGIIIAYATFTLPLAVFLYFSFISNIPRTLDEAALLDGAKSGQMFFLIIFPLLKPVTITVFVINFMNAWNDFVTPLYLLNDSEKWGMIMQVYKYYGTYQTDWQYVCTVIAEALIPVVVLYIFGQKYIISGMTEGAVKG